MKIAIIGGGIGGLATALALKNKGIIAKVFEAAPQIREIGAGLWAAPNAMNVLNRLGVAQDILDAGVEYSHIFLEDNKGDKLQEQDVTMLKKKYGYGTVAMQRSVLLNILYNKLDKDSVHTNKACVEVKELNNNVIVSFTDSTEEEFDLVIGADGLHSKVRKYVTGNVKYRYSGQTSWRWLMDYDLPENQATSLSEIWGTKKGQRMGYGYSSNNKVYVYLTLGSLAHQKDNPETVVNDLLNLYSNYPIQAKDIISKALPENIIRTDLFDMEPMKNWIKGNIVLLGDAAHATTPNLGQGAGQAIESAFVLAECLANEKNIQVAIANYQKIRMKKAHFITNTSWQFGQLTNLSGRFGNFIKFGMLKYFPKKISDKQFEKVFQLNF